MNDRVALDLVWHLNDDANLVVEIETADDTTLARLTFDHEWLADALSEDLVEADESQRLENINDWLRAAERFRARANQIETMIQRYLAE